MTTTDTAAAKATARRAAARKGAATRKRQNTAKAATAKTAEEVAPATASTDPRERLALAKAEHKMLQAWIKDGSKPPRPATLNLDALNGEYEARGRKPRTATGRGGSVPRVARPAMTFLRDGKAMSPASNKFSCLAYQCTKGVDGDRPRISTDELRTILAGLGVDDPAATEWEVTLSNGVTIGAKFTPTQKRAARNGKAA